MPLDTTAKNPSRVALVIEDDPAAQHMLVRTLREVGFLPIAFGSGEAALAWIEMHGAPALVSVDVQLPRMSGFRFCEVLRASQVTRDVPAVIVTARIGVQDEARAIELGAAFLPKPLHIREYMSTVLELAPELPVTKTAAPQSVHFWVRSPVVDAGRD